MSTPTSAPTLTTNESLLAAVRQAPEGTIAICMDPNDGELRAYDHEAGNEVHYWRFFPRDRYTTHRDYTGAEWERAPFTGYCRDVMLGGGWIEIPVPSAVDTISASTLVREGKTPAERVGELEVQVTELQSQLSTVQRRLYRARNDLSSFKERVAEVASRYARENDVVDTVQEAANELDIELQTSVDYRATVTFTVEFHATRTDSSYAPDEDWVRDSMGGIGDVENAIRRYLCMDSDSEDFEVDDINYTVDDVEEN